MKVKKGGRAMQNIKVYSLLKRDVLDQRFHQPMRPRPPSKCPIGPKKPLSDHRHKPGRNSPSSSFSPPLLSRLYKLQSSIKRLFNFLWIFLRYVSTGRGVQFSGAFLYAEQHEQSRIYVRISYQSCDAEAISLIYEKMLQAAELRSFA